MTKQEEPIIIINSSIDTRCRFVLNFPIYKRIWRFLMLVIKGWCYFD